MNQHRARITWLTEEQGGRTVLPGERRYATIARFPDDSPDWPDGAWTVVVDFDTPPSEQGNPSLGFARFLMENAPQHKLHAGSRFQLHEGLRRVATVEVLAGS